MEDEPVDVRVGEDQMRVTRGTINAQFEINGPHQCYFIQVAWQAATNHRYTLVFDLGGDVQGMIVFHTNNKMILRIPTSIRVDKDGDLGLCFYTREVKLRVQ